MKRNGYKITFTIVIANEDIKENAIADARKAVVENKTAIKVEIVKA